MTDRPGPDPSVSDTALIRAILEAYPPAVGTADVAETVDLSSQATARHLDRLADAGYLDTDKLGNVRIWWVTPQGRAYLGDSGDPGHSDDSSTR